MGWALGYDSKGASMHLRRSSCRRRAAPVFVAFCATLTWLQVHFWRTNVDLWSHSLEVTGENSLAENHLGDAFYVRGQFGSRTSKRPRTCSTPLGPRGAPTAPTKPVHDPLRAASRHTAFDLSESSAV